MVKSNIKDLASLELALISFGYEIKKSSGKEVNILVNDDRVGALVRIAEALGGKYNPKGGSSSIGRTELPNSFKVYAKPKGGGSGAGSAATDLAESAQCLYSAAAWYGKDFTGNTLSSVEKYIDTTSNAKEIISKLQDQWIQSCMSSAEVLKKKYGGKKYIFHRGSKWVSSLENHWKKLNKEEREFSNLNKWSPADIYMISDAGKKIDLTKTSSIMELNRVMLKALMDKDIIGVSLKQTKNASISYKNLTDKRSTYKFGKVTVGKRGFFQSGDAYLIYDGGEIQFRTFGSTWQGEIKGKTANMGKISGGPITAIMKRNSITILPQKDIIDKSEELLKQFYRYYKYFETSPMSEKDFILEVSKKDQNWWVSKFLSAQLMYEIDTKSTKIKDKITSAMIGYAASESELSGPYIKVS